MKDQTIEQRYPNIKEAMSQVGSRFEHIFEILDSLELGVKREREGSECEQSYINEKRESLVRAANAISHDIRVWRIRNKMEE